MTSVVLTPELNDAPAQSIKTNLRSVAFLSVMYPARLRIEI